MTGPASTERIEVKGCVRRDPQHGLLLVLDDRLTGRETFLSARLLLGTPPDLMTVRVRIFSFDDISMLAPLSGEQPDMRDSGRWSGTLLLPHGSRPPNVPADLAQAAETAGVDLSSWTGPDARQMLTFLGEAREKEVRDTRINMIVASLAPGQEAP
ncbi:hypothetical protein [Streptomyces sp. NPDC051561]|uniref:hypothetical protein n=1 Tax=Streptomyces sp. NPDC051561 TaxID=3365658 RepID=UPI00379F986E